MIRPIAVRADNFLALDHLEIVLAPGVIAITGAPGAGKTSILEAALFPLLDHATGGIPGADRCSNVRRPGRGFVVELDLEVDGVVRTIRSARNHHEFGSGCWIVVDGVVAPDTEIAALGRDWDRDHFLAICRIGQGLDYPPLQWHGSTLEALLAKLTGLGALALAHERLSSARVRLRDEMGAVESRINSIGTFDVPQISDLDAARGSRDELARDLEVARANVADLDNQVRSATRRIERMDTELAGLEAVEAERHRLRAAAAARADALRAVVDIEAELRGATFSDVRKRKETVDTQLAQAERRVDDLETILESIDKAAAPCSVCLRLVEPSEVHLFERRLSLARQSLAVWRRRAVNIEDMVETLDRLHRARAELDAIPDVVVPDEPDQNRAEMIRQESARLARQRDEAAERIPGVRETVADLETRHADLDAAIRAAERVDDEDARRALALEDLEGEQKQISTQLEIVRVAQDGVLPAFERAHLERAIVAANERMAELVGVAPPAIRYMRGSTIIAISDPEGERLAAQASWSERPRLAAATLAAIRMTSERMPGLVIMDDLPLADEGVLRSLAAIRASGATVLLSAAVVPEGVADAVWAVSIRDGFARIRAT